MKALLLFVLVCTTIQFPLETSAQFNARRTVEIGGDLNYSYQRYSPRTSISILSFDAILGVMVAKGLELSFEPYIASLKAELISSNEFGFLISPAYHFNIKSNGFPYIAAIGGYGLSDSENENATVKNIGGELGVKTKIGESTLVLVRFQYLRRFVTYQDDIGDPYTPDDYELDALTFGIGFRYFIPSTKQKPKSTS